MTAIVQTEGLVKRYDRTLAVAGIDLVVEPGRDLRPGRPERRRQDDDPAHARHVAAAVGGDGRDRRLVRDRNPDQVRRVIGFMPDVFGVYDDMKVWEYLDFFARCYGLPAAGGAG